MPNSFDNANASIVYNFLVSLCAKAHAFVQYGVSMNGQPIPVANGTASSVGNDPLTNLLAGMSKHQLFDVMVQMKVRIFWHCDQLRNE